MNNKIFILLPAIWLSACAATVDQLPADWVDVTSDERDVGDYWIAESKTAPMYPASAVRNGRVGCSRVSFFINEEGRAVGIESLDSYPEGTFVRATKDAVERWRWVPAEQNSARQPVKSKLQMDFWFDGATNMDQAKEYCERDGSTSWGMIASD